MNKELQPDALYDEPLEVADDVRLTVDVNRKTHE
jgi:hypothetical protein